MPTDPCTPAERSRAASRRAQILQAASDCFHDHGFHGASISLISKAAGMSAGHIYHYFENKEAIIAAIVERDLDRLLTLSAEMRAASDVLEALIGRAAEGVIDNLDPRTAGLKVEIVAEASRNPAVAKIVRAADRCCMSSLSETLRILRANKGHSTDDATLQGMTEVLASMFEGLLLRAIRNPDLDRNRVVAIFQRVIRQLVTDPN
ncbi:TetR family transcriptional regulator [Azoarcus communis]|uniref:TetR/AcrR family transcriptional regulator n=1 Tax=Parazoarcus communis TaxID=41977 RepID=UPI001459A17C|nr:TetR/AcrR family transcriptional regulator [Parazoarcus communis]NMG50644.1 TetR family transcriptional regulator [Parazoarcus communis]